MGDAGDLSDVSYIVSTTEPNLPNSEILKIIPLSIIATDNDVTNTNVETDLFSFSVPADTLGTDNALRLKMTGTLAANSGSATITIKVYYGSTIMFQDTTGAFGASAILSAWFLELILSAHNATNSQELGGIWQQGNRAAAAAGLGDLAVSGIGTGIEGTAAENSTTTLTFKVTITWSAAHSTYSVKRKSAILELIKA